MIAVIERSTNLNGARTPSRLELTYLAGADDLARMVSEGTFPYPGYDTTLVRSPRVGDGLLRLDAAGRVTFASPNAQSAYRRLGLTADLMGTELGSATAQLAPSGAPVDESLMLVARGRAPRETEIDVNGTVVQLRSIPLVVGGQRTGALVLVRDVTELRRRERELLTKEATIREIHHRVKNNLQTVAALLRLQARRLSGARGAGGAPGGGAPGRVDRHRARDALPRARGDRGLRRHRGPGSDDGRRGVLARGAGDAEDHRPVRHASGDRGDAAGHGAHRTAAERAAARVRAGAPARAGGDAGIIEVVAARAPELLTVTVTDSGAGLPPGFDLENTTSLGLQIVRTLVEGELGGQISLRPRAGGGTIAVVDLPVRYEPEACGYLASGEPLRGSNCALLP